MKIPCGASQIGGESRAALRKTNIFERSPSFDNTTKCLLGFTAYLIHPTIHPFSVGLRFFMPIFAGGKASE